MSPILILTLLIHITYAHDFSRLNWTLKDHISSEILKFATFDLATRTDCRGKKLEVSVYEQIDSELGRQELKAGFEYVKSLVQLALPENLRKSCEHFRGEYGSECLGDLGKRYVYDRGQVHIKRFSTALASGNMLMWPLYCYDRDLLEPQFKVWKEDVSFDSQGSIARTDWGPPTPKFEKFGEQLKKVDVFNGTANLPWVSSSPKWLPGTSPKDQHPDLYKLYHIIPLPALVSLYETFSAVWHEMDAGRRQMASAPLRVLNRTAEAAKRILAGRRLNSSNFDYDYEALKEEISSRYNFDYDPMKILFWAPGNLYWGYDDLIIGNGKEEFHVEVKVIIGETRYLRAEIIYNHILDFMNRAGSPINSNHVIDHDKVVKDIMNTPELLTEIKELFLKLVYFGLERTEPYPVDVSLWEPQHSTGVWAWKIIPENESVVPYYSPEDPDFMDNRIAMVNMLHDSCHVISERSFRKRRSILANENAYLTFGETEVRSLLTNETDLGLILKEFSAKFKDSYSTSLSNLSDFVRNESINYYTSQHCDAKSYLCSRIQTACSHDNMEDVNIKCDESDEPKDRRCPVSEIAREGYVASPSFPDWCNGKRFENKNQITVDSAVLRVLTFNQTKPNRFNKKIMVELFDEYNKTKQDQRYNFMDYVERQIQKYGSKASRILNEACKVYKEGPKKPEVIDLSFNGFVKEVCTLPTRPILAIYCVVDKLLGSLPTNIIAAGTFPGFYF